MPKLTVERSVVIDAPIESIFEHVRNFRHWPDWSPWLIIEKEAQVDFASDGNSYCWKGDVVGSGEIRLLEEIENKRLRLELSIFKPWKSKSDVRFEFLGKGESTEVRWKMKGSLPFFLFFMRRMMEALIGMDYERGLGMLKDFSETGLVASSLEFFPKETYCGGRYVAVVRDCQIAELGDAMEQDFGALAEHFEGNAIELSAKPFSIYSKWDMSEGTAQYSACFPVKEKPDALAAPFVYGELPELNAFVVQHTGAYRHLGNAWSAGMMRGRQKVFKQSKKLYPFEVYETEIGSVPDAEIVTKIFFPIK